MRKNLAVQLLAMCLILVCVGCTYKSQSKPINNKDYKINGLILGLSYVPDGNHEYRQNTLTHLEYLNIDQVRVGQSWRLREPTQGEYNMSPVIDKLDFYNKNNIKVLMTIDTHAIPDWALKLNRDSFLSSFRDFVKVMLDTHGHQISIIQFGNEWDWEIDKYLNGDVSLFIEMNNILYDEVNSFKFENRPLVALGSISIGGVRALAFSQNKINNVYFENSPLYSEKEIEDYQPWIIQVSERANNLLKECEYDLIDTHLYDDYWNWHHYIDAVKYVLEEVDGDKDISIVVSEFGGPNPKMELEDDEYRARQLYYYVKTIDELGICKAYYFKLHEHTGVERIFHPYSYLIDKQGNVTETYEMLRRFGE